MWLFVNLFLLFCLIFNFILFLLIDNFFIACVFFTPLSAGRLSQESAWKHISSVLQESSQYSNQSYECFDKDSSSAFQLKQFFFQTLADHSKSTN